MESENNLKFDSVGKGNSLFAFVKKYCLGETSGLSHNSAFHRLCSLMRKMDVKTAIVEDIMPSHSEINKECAALNVFFKENIEFKIYRVTFLSESISSKDALPKIKSDSFLSSSIVINFKDPIADWKSYLFSAVVTIPKIKNNFKFGDIPLLNNYLHIYKTFKREINVSENSLFEFSITGTFFCQQNSLTSVCSHASLCMVLNNMESEAGIITPEDINKIIGVDHITKRFGPKANVEFTKKEFEAVLTKYGLTYELLDFIAHPKIQYDDHIYNYIESRCSVLLVFNTDENTGHVVPILGHTLNSDLWSPEAEIAYSPMSRQDFLKSASAWVDHFIINDDNFGMYLCLPVATLKRATLPKDDPNFRANHAIAVIPADVTTLPTEARWASSILMIDIMQWCQNNNLPLNKWPLLILKKIFDAKPIVIRTFLVTKEDYSKSLEETDFENISFSMEDKQQLTANLPTRFWLSEITLPDLYTANKSKIIDFFYKCDNPKLEESNQISDRWIQMRLPGRLIKRTATGNHTSIELSVKSHYPLLRLERQHDLLDW